MRRNSYKMKTDISVKRLLFVPTFALVFFLFVDLAVLWYLVIQDIDERLIQSKLQSAELVIYQLHDSIEDLLISTPLASRDFTHLGTTTDDLRLLLSQSVLHDQDFLYEMIVSLDGRILVHSSSDEEGKQLTGIIDQQAIESDSLVVQTLHNENGMIYDIAVPFEVEGKKLGVLRLGLSKQSIEDDLGELTGGLLRKHFIAFVLAIVGTVVVLVLIGGTMNRLRRLYAAAETANRLSYIGTIAAGLAHEIRNPLNAIRINAQMAGEALTTFPEIENIEETRRLLTSIECEIGHLNDLMTGFLHAAKPSPLTIGEVNLNALIEAVLRPVSVECDQRGIRVETFLNDPDVTVKGDTDLLRQALFNLIINAIQAMPNGGTLSITTRHEQGYRRTHRHTIFEPHYPRPPGGWVTVTISDTGVGIPRETRDRIFDMFYTTKPDGAGLGLSIVHKTIVQHGGGIEIDSREGEGAAFTLWLPVIQLVSGEEDHGRIKPNDSDRG